MPRAAACLALFLPLALACNSGGDGSPSGPTRPLVAASIVPSPIVARVCDCGPLVGELDFEAELVLAELAGLPARLQSFRVELRSEADGRVVATADFAVDAAEGRIPAGGTLRRAFAFHFPGADAAVPGQLLVAAAFVDDAGTVFQANAEARVLPPA